MHRWADGRRTRDSWREGTRQLWNWADGKRECKFRVKEAALCCVVAEVQIFHRVQTDA